MGDQDGTGGSERTVLFSPRLYSIEAVRVAAERFGPHAAVRIVEEGDTFRVTLSSRGGAVDDDLVDAFCNHVLFETVRARRAARPEAGS
jgi:hypothetical protein